jgi:hypothetical protein
MVVASKERPSSGVKSEILSFWFFCGVSGFVLGENRLVDVTVRLR